MTSETPLERRLRDVLRTALDAETGPHPNWSDAPAATMPKAHRATVRVPFRVLALAAVVALGGAIAVAGSGAFRPQQVAVVATPGPSATAAVTGPPTAPPTASPKPTSSAAPTPSPTGGPGYSTPMPLQHGRFETQFMWDLPFAVSVVVPDGWEWQGPVVRKESTLELSVSLIEDFYADPCADELVDPEVVSISDLAAAFESLPGLHVTRTEEPAALGNLPLRTGTTSQYAEFAADASATCADPGYRLWKLDPFYLARERGWDGPLEFTLTATRRNGRVWFVDADAWRFAVMASWSDTATSNDITELQGLIDSFDLSRTVPDVAFGACTLSPFPPPRSMTAPYERTMGDTVAEMWGAVPSPLPFEPPLAQINFRGTPWTKWQGGDDTGSKLTGPGDTFTTMTGVGGFQGTWIFLAPGTWRASLVDNTSGCRRHLQILVKEPAG